MLLLEESIKLLWKVLEEGKANKKHINSQRYEFLKVASKAIRRTLSYIRDENKRDTKTEEELSELWANVALAARPFDSDLAERCYLKGNYWANPNSWSDEEIKNAGIEIGRIDTEIRNHFKGKARAKKSKQQKAIEKTEQGNKDSKKKFSWKKIGTIVVSSIVILAAFTTLILNLDKIKEMFRGRPAKQKIEDIDIEQKGETLSNVTGVDMSNNPRDTEMGKVKIHQEGKSLRNVTGMKMEFDANSGEVELKDKIEIKQKGPHGQSSVTFNADQPEVKITFNKKSEDGDK